MTQRTDRCKTNSAALNRRQFLAGAGTTTLAFTIVQAEHVRGSVANSKLTIGVVGCGGRGSWIADLFQKHGGYQVVAGADYFQDRVDEFGDRFKIESARRYTGLSCYKRMLENKPDAVVIQSPPYFHPEQTAAAIDAGAHVYLAKPVAVDVPGCTTIEECGEKATQRKLCLMVDFQTRNDPLYREAIKRTQYGDIGRIVNGEVTYVAGVPFTDKMEMLKANPSDPELKLRAWGIFQKLSGDIITEQNIHSLDVMTWVMDDHPTKAYGSGGQKARMMGDCWDHFAIIFTFPKDVLMNFTSRQYGEGYDDILCRVYGTQGTLDTHYSSDVWIRGKLPFKGGKAENLYLEGAVRNIAAFHGNITRGQYANTTVPPSVRSNLTTILGRTAAYKQSEVTWDELLKTNEKWEADLKGLIV